MTKRHLLSMIVALAMIVLAAPAVAAQANEEFLGGKVRTGDSITVPSGETVEGDLYIFGGTIAVNGTVAGDLIVFGGQIDIDGLVEGDLFVMGGTITVPGTVLGDVRMAGGQVSLSGEAGEDAAIVGGQTTMSGSVGEDFMFSGGQATLSGDVARDVVGSAGTYNMTGTIGGIEDVNLTESSTVAVEERNPFVSALLRTISLVIFGALLVWLAFGRLTSATERVQARWLESALWGLGFLVTLAVTPFIVLIAGVLLAILSGIAGLGAWVGFFVFSMIAALAATALVAFAALVFVAPVTVGTWLGQLLMPAANRFAWMAVGIAILVGLGMIPVAGPIVGFLVMILGVGAWLAGLRKVETVPEPLAEPEMATVG